MREVRPLRTGSSNASKKTCARLFGALVVLAGLLLGRTARADRELIVPFHEGGHLVLDQLSGLRLSAGSGLAYAGPAGLSYRSEKADAFTPGAPSSDLKTTTFWFAPSVDIFVTDHLSIGGLVEVAHTSGSATSGGQSIDLPGTTALTFLPRVGFYAPFGDRFGLWPRAGVGWAQVQSVSFASTGGAAVTDTFRSMILDVDITLVYRFTEVFFMKIGPEVGVTLGGRHSQEVGGISAGADAQTLQISGVVGFGANLEL